MQDGVTGFIVEDVEGAVRAVAHLDAIDRGVVRATFERRFSVDVMATKYESAYASVLGAGDEIELTVAKRNQAAPALLKALNGEVPIVAP
jgi:hypothetical protein